MKLNVKQSVGRNYKNTALERFWEALYENDYSKKENYKIPKIKNAPLLKVK
jgi:hypothetical protein